MSDNAEMGERPGDPALRGGVGVGAGTDDYVDGAAEQEFEERGTAADPVEGTPDARTPGEQQVPFAETDAMASRMTPVDSWGVGSHDLPHESPAEELENDT